MPRAFVIGGTHSGCGKTTTTLAIMAALHERGLSVAGFKAGPDFIDPMLHAAVTGRPSINLDSWLCPPDFVRETFSLHAAGADVAIVEGVMGLFDGVSGEDEAGSTAALAKLLGVPVVLVVDTSAAVRSAAATLLGFERFDPHLAIAGALWSRTGGDVHRGWLSDAARASCSARVLGGLRFRAELGLPERHLGLVTPQEHPIPRGLIEALASAAREDVDLDALLALAAPLPEAPQGAPRRSAAEPIRIAVARDAAFCFIYEDNLRILRSLGAEIVFWSPLTEAPPQADGLYLGGGYPEVHARQLSENGAALRGVREAAGRGVPIYAECGGLIYLCQKLHQQGGEALPLAGLVPGEIAMRDRLTACAYREVVTGRDNLLGPEGTMLRSHEFHWSDWVSAPPADRAAFRLEGRQLGYAAPGITASYLHVHFGHDPRLAERWLDHCRAARPSRGAATRA